MVNRNPIRILLVEDNAGDVRLLRETLADIVEARFDLVHVGPWREGVARFAREPADVVLLDLLLPDSNGMDTLAGMHAAAPDAPIVVLTGLNDEAMGLEAVRVGAQDYLVKGRFDADSLAARSGTPSSDSA